MTAKQQKIMERDLYVDNVISSVRDENEATQYFYEARQIMATAGFSCIVLHWLKSAKSLKRFVTNRVNETRKSTSEAEWRYCPTEHNSADLVTRGITEIHKECTVEKGAGVARRQTQMAESGNNHKSRNVDSNR